MTNVVVLPQIDSVGREQNRSMALFDEADPQRPDQLDWKILQNGAISLYFDGNVLNKACTWFYNHKYQIYLFACIQWKTVEDFIRRPKILSAFLIIVEQD